MRGRARYPPRPHRSARGGEAGVVTAAGLTIAVPRGALFGEPLRRRGSVRVATKYPVIAKDYFSRTGRQADIVEVKGSVEIGPLTGLVDAIVDLTASGRTLAENHLVEHEQIVECTARLIANPVSHKLKAEAMDSLVEKMREAVAQGER